MKTLRDVLKTALILLILVAVASGASFVEWTGASWVMTTTNGISVHPTATGLYPPETGWPDIDSSSVSLSVSSMAWLETNGDAKAFSYTELYAYTNGVGGLWKKLDSDGWITDTLTYTNGFTPGMWTVFDLWMNIPTSSGTSQAGATNASGGYLLDVDGNVLMVNP